ncbi:MAG: ABC transporter permease subunit [Candidatus Peribacteria bacterium]|nr:ABC transporter permease subunit [Candidatus Peribacteria bacterium]
MIGTAYYIGAMLSAFVYIDNVDIKLFSLVALTFMFIAIFLVLFGACLGAIYPKIRTPLLVSAGGTFIFYTLASMATKANIHAVRYITPYSYFNANRIVDIGGYDLKYIIAFLVLCVVFLVVGYTVFTKKDITFIS